MKLVWIAIRCYYTVRQKCSGIVVEERKKAREQTEDVLL